MQLTPIQEREQAAAHLWKTEVPLVSPEVTCKELLSRFQEQDEPPCVVLCDNAGQIAGLIMREQFYRKLTGRFAAELFYDRTVSKFADPHPLIMEISRDPAEIIDAALAREEERFYDCVILTDNGRFNGVITVHHLMMLSRLLQQEARHSRYSVLASSRKAVETIEVATREVTSAAEQGQALTEKMIDLTQDGRIELQMVKLSFERVLSMIMAQAEQIGHLRNMADDIMRISASIRELADRSGMLAMNAVIEASHAGEHGRGFSVVANEVKNLANQTKSFSDEIGATLKQVNALVHQAVQYSADSELEMEQSKTRVDSADQTFQNMDEAVKAVELADKEISRLAHAARQQAEYVIEELNNLG
ncbi:hypothetical protein AWM70_03505 [Paenibacillus yonginensis]|uniref:Methyl-accepting transducer domain-containing protein n=1 Tax=Paenibacillus yonginensis TaxID=1462996 RepID=A0A1B1MX67_9BACL|nr:methyl-accepting chemotaxis protein [Paenibacillus yonginensis]ANS73755.1 hypothetical protein AWM70_03505 [Paenibacillus yonginensis]